MFFFLTILTQWIKNWNRYIFVYKVTIGPQKRVIQLYNMARNKSNMTDLFWRSWSAIQESNYLPYKGTILLKPLCKTYNLRTHLNLEKNLNPSMKFDKWELFKCMYLVYIRMVLFLLYYIHVRVYNKSVSEVVRFQLPNYVWHKGLKGFSQMVLWKELLARRTSLSATNTQLHMYINRCFDVS